MFKDRKLLIVTKHGKETVLAPKLEASLGVTCTVATLFDTDSLGTFSGEVNRPADAVTVLREKCVKGMHLEGFDLALASEGSFGAHPGIFFAPADEEFLMLTDLKNNIEIVAKVLSTNTNFNGRQVKSKQELKAFAEMVKFPGHALILKKSEDDLEGMVKGITDYDTLMDTFATFSKLNGSAYAETDMRAMYNPTRMEVIAEAADKLIEKANSLCPQCKCPGFGISDATPGLPCKDCGNATKSTLYYTYTCRRCFYSEDKYYPRGIKNEEPMYCDFCNP